METVSRRRFLKQSALITSGSLLVPQFLQALQKEGATNAQDQILIVLQLSGGNDGLNTMVPYRNDRYYQMRPTLSIRQENVLKVSDEMGFHPAFSQLRDLYDEGLLTVINNVGYPNPDRSHFRSMDIWQTASNANEYLSTGWIGRYLDAACPGDNSAIEAIEIDDMLGLALRSERIKGMAIKDPKKLFEATQRPFFKKVAEGTSDEPMLAYLYKTMAETASNAAYVYDRSSVMRSSATYPNTDFGKRLKTIAELIQSGIQTNVYYASLSGFDTHVSQPDQQARLLTTYAEAVRSLVNDLKASGNFNRTLIMTFSEFGRRVEENASGGTDHGTANNLFVMGGKLKSPGFLNKKPDLQKLDEGDLIFDVDFRQVYATLLRKWLNTDDKKILGQEFSLLNLV
ncbi:MAG: DUF1501 domain-containing protein [Cyclobacteriaceae bacterium]|nr:DUF1501 domain-containing protein [Cyclobacteriaceae bacterium]